MKLCEQLPGVWHRVYMDNAFPQVRNLEKMCDMKVYGAGTMRPQFGFPPELHELVRKLNDKQAQPSGRWSGGASGSRAEQAVEEAAQE